MPILFTLGCLYHAAPLPVPVSAPVLALLLRWHRRVLRKMIRIMWKRHRRYFRKQHHNTRASLPPCEPPSHPVLHRRKPDWVIHAVLYEKALCRERSCRQIADIFNRRFAGTHHITVGKTWVSNTLNNHHHQLWQLRREIKNRQPYPIAFQHTWGLDLTGKCSHDGELHCIMGVVEHHSRACLQLIALPDKRTTTILRHLLDLIDRFGAPRRIITDNEAIFTSRLFRSVLSMLHIRHKTTEAHSPWQNGRIERFFGTLKQQLHARTVQCVTALNRDLATFRFWYNHIRPHRNLHGRTPAEVWNGDDVFSRTGRNEYFFRAWNGQLNGYYLPS